MGNFVRAAARAILGSLPAPRFHSIEECLGLASLAVLILLPALQPPPGPALEPGPGPDRGRLTAIGAPQPVPLQATAVAAMTPPGGGHGR